MLIDYCVFFVSSGRRHTICALVTGVQTLLFRSRAPTDHLAFGKGSRSCVGSQLARVEIRVAIEALLGRYDCIELNSEAPPPNFRALYMRSMAPLHVRLA